MNSRIRLRRVGILCCHLLRNVAFYLSWYDSENYCKDRQFWRTGHNNFLDIYVLEWCKLFVDVRGKHHYSTVVKDPVQFKIDLLVNLALTDTEFADYIKRTKTYRDKFVAHLDELNNYEVPVSNIIKESVIFLYEHLLAQESINDTFSDAPNSATQFFNDYFAQGKAVYSAASSAVN